MPETTLPRRKALSESELPDPERRAITRLPAISWHIPEVDGVRAFAMLMVYVYHVWEFGGCPAKNVNLFGFKVDLFSPIGQFPSGVDLFMVLSGFCLFLPLCKSDEAVQKWHWKSYAVRRFRRIAPPYYAAIVYTVLLPFALKAFFRLFHQNTNWQSAPSLWQFVTHLTFTHTLFLSTWSGISGSFWSLGLEAQFYAVFPLVVLGYKRYGLRFLAAMIGISVIYRVAANLVLPQTVAFEADKRPFLLSIFFLGRWMQFAAGMLAAYFVANYRKNALTWSARQGAAAILTALLVYVLAVSNFVGSAALFPLRDILLAVAYMLLLTTVSISETPLRRCFNNKIIVRFAFISYSVFLLHQTTAWYISEFMKHLLHIPGEARFYLLITIGFLLVIGISYGFFLIFERPFLSSHLKRAEKAEVS